MSKKTPKPAPEAPPIDISKDCARSPAGFGALPFVEYQKLSAWIRPDQLQGALDKLRGAGYDARTITLREYCADGALEDSGKAELLAEWDCSGCCDAWMPHSAALAAFEYTLVAVINNEHGTGPASDAIAILARPPGTGAPHTWPGTGDAAAAAAAPADEATANAAQFLIGNLMAAAKRRFVDLSVPWRELKEGEQERTLQYLADDVRVAVGKAIRAIQSNERVNFRAEVESVQFKGATDIKATLKLTGGPHSHALADAAGSFVTVVIEDVSELLDIPEEAVRGEADQKPLFDASTEGTALDTAPEAAAEATA